MRCAKGLVGYENTQNTKQILTPSFIATDVTMSGLPAAQDKTLPAGPVSLEDEANWLVAWQKNLSRQSLYNNIVKEVFNSMTRIIGWALISFVSRYSVTTACLAKV